LRAHIDDLQAGAAELRTTKVIVLGNGRVGKTQLCRRLRGLSYDDHIPSTHGITITTTTFDDNETLNLWDFGGQDIYHGAHALFMRTRAIFVVAWTPELEALPTHDYEGMTFNNHPLIYWIELVRAMGAPQSPQIVVQCQCEHRRDEVRALPLPPGHHDDPQRIALAYSAKKNRGRGGLDDAIRDALTAIRERQGLATIGRGRALVIERLEALRAEDEARPGPERKHRILTHGEFETICAEAGGVSSPDALLHFLHQTGLVFHDERLGDRILLDQSWALDAIYTLFDRQSTWRHLRATRGRFTRELLATTAWRGFSAAEQHVFIDLMLACGICFPHVDSDRRGDDTEYIAPDLLPEEKDVAEHLEGRWDEAAPTQRLTYSYEFLHPGLFRGLISRIGAQAKTAGVYWRTGLWLYAKDSRARVRIDLQMFDARRGQITCAIQGQDPRLMAWVRERLDEEHNLYGQAQLSPEIDEWDATDVKHHSGRPPAVDEDPCAAEGSREPQRPSFAPLPVTEFVRNPNRPEAFISYARADGSSTAEALHRALSGAGVDSHMDTTDIGTGDRISAYMERLADGDRVFVLLSADYLRSPCCMYELFEIWRRSQHDPDKFLNRVIPILLPGVAINTLAARQEYARFWRNQHSEYKSYLNDDPALFGVEDFGHFKQISDYLSHISDILFLLSDRLIPRDLAMLERAHFAPLLALLRGASQAKSS
jgi:internalin A